MAEYSCPQCGGESDAGYAEEHWREVGDGLCCSAYCAALEGGASEEEAQEARAEHTQSVEGEMREQRLAQARAILEAEGEL